MVFELVNEQGVAIGSQTYSRRAQYEPRRNGNQISISYKADDFITLRFNRVKAADISDRGMSIRVASVNGKLPEQTPFQITMIPDWENNTHLLVENGVVKGFKSGVDASRYRNLAIPSTYWTEPITAIENGAFEKKQLTRVIIGSNVTTIGDNAFANNQLTSVGIPDSVTTIGSRAFFSNKLYSVFLGKGVVSIGDKAFRGDTAFSNGFPFTLTSVVIPASVTYIGYGAITINRYGVVTRFAGANVSYRDANEAITDGIGEDFPKYYKKKGMKAGKYTYKSISGGWGIFTWNYSPE